MSDRLFIIIPAYNEQENIRQVVSDWYPVVEKYGTDSRLVVIDDGSRDSTYSILQDMSKTMPRLTALTKANAGHGATLLFGYKYALENGADYVFQTDSDGQTLPSEFEPFWIARSKYDVSIGYRNKRRDGLSRVFVTKILRLVVYLCFRVYVLDANTPYRLMSAATLKENLKYIPDDFFLTNVALAAIYKKRRQKVHFIPISFRPRQGGRNSINLIKIIKVGLSSIRSFIVINDKVEK
ncbi:MAG: glycosyltransferase family 2 protein [Lachnospiraceae bacterium]|nr:glycosyltransferase family 2 protein [Lachnospiraceae bacterium]